jgi:hypothetical protein
MQREKKQIPVVGQKAMSEACDPSACACGVVQRRGESEEEFVMGGGRIGGGRRDARRPDPTQLCLHVQRRVLTAYQAFIFA